MARWAAVTAALALLVASAASAEINVTILDAPYTTPWAAVELSTSVIVLSFMELEPQNINGKAITPCQDGIDKAKALGMKNIQLQYTAYYTGATKTEVTGWCHKDQSMKCQALTPALLTTLQSGMEKCVQYAVTAGFSSIVVLPKIDYTGEYYWRNDLWFNPMQKFGGYSYVDAILQPLAAALNTVAAKAPEGVNFYLSMQAETAKSVIYGPRNWLQAVPLVKSTLTKGLAAKATAMKLGISQNNRRVCACLDTHKVDDTYGVYNYLRAYGKVFNEVQKADDLRFDTQALSYLYSQMDFLGMSAYVMVYPGYTTKDMEMSCIQHSLGMSLLGINIQQLIAGGKELIIFETGVGGGDGYGGASKNVTAAAAAPYNNVYGSYSLASDPWQSADMKAYRQMFYEQYLRWLARGSGPRFHVSKVFLFSSGSTDVLGVRWESSSEAGSYKDEKIIAAVTAHNAAVHKA